MLCRDTVKWLYELEKDFTWNSGKAVAKDYEFADPKGNVRLIIKADGAITVPKGYAWDGCTPKVCLLDVLVGVPDGAVHVRTGKPKTYHASLIHDALYQFLDSGLPYSRGDADDFFLNLLTENGFIPRYVYYWAVRLFGGVFRWFGVNYGKKSR